VDLQQVKAITFDAGGTLIEPCPSVGETYFSVATELGFSNISPHILNQQFAAAWKQKQRFDYSRDAWRRLVEQTFAGCCVVETKLFEALYERFARPDVWHVYDDVEPTLRALQQRGYKLAVISNWDDRLGPLLERLGLRGCFDAVVLSTDIGATKPSARIFRHACMTLQMGPQMILHVGDSLEEDVEGAKSAGLHALLLNRREISQSPVAISTLTDLLSM
jgi:putative hydrolase of the HAD superfamily